MTASTAPTDHLRYPIGPFRYAGTMDPAQRAAAIETIAATPARLRAAVAGLSAEQLDTPYRDGGWTVRQVAHHIPDSHMNGYIRLKMALTEERPTIKPYDEERWSALGDARQAPVEISLTLLTALHERFAMTLRALTDADYARTFVHPERGAVMTIDELLALYAWHGAHHVGHITSLRERKGWA